MDLDGSRRFRQSYPTTLPPTCMASAAASAAGRRGSATLTLFLIRHAESQNNLLNARYGDKGWEKYLRYHDAALSEQGCRQINALEGWLRVSPAHTARLIRAAADPARGAGRFRLVSSPMRRALKTTSAVVAGLDGVRPDPCFVEVDPFCFEEGGCYHKFPDLMDETGLSALQAMTPAELDALAASSPAPVTFPGLTSDEVTDPATLALALGIDVGRAAFVRSVMPGMDQGWYAGRNGHVETRGEMMARARKFALQVRALAMADEVDDVVLVSHGDFMDAILKVLSAGPSVAAAADEGRDWRELDSLVRFCHTNTGVTRVEVGRQDGVAHIMSMNEAGHLDSEERTGGEMIDGWGKWRKHAW